MATRPTDDPRAAVLDTFDDVWDAFATRLDGLTGAEALWEPVAGCWSVRPSPELDEGFGRVDGAGDREADPAPVTTIAWRCWHIAVDCLDSYGARRFATTGAGVEGAVWPLDVAAGWRALDGAWTAFRTSLHATPAAAWHTALGDGWGPFADHDLHDLAQHALHEVTHHAAEVALLRDLHRAGLR